MPATELDTRFSEPEAVATTWADTEALLETAELAWITTVRADGRPHVTPLVPVWLGGALHFCTGPEEQKAANLRANGEVALTIGSAPWDRGTDVVVEGRAERVTDDALLADLAEAWAGRWDGSWRFDVRRGGFWTDDGGEVLVFAVRPRKVLAFGKGQPFSQTRHLFPAGWAAPLPVPLMLFAELHVRDFRTARPWYVRLLGEPAFTAHETEEVWELAPNRSIAVEQAPGRAGYSAVTAFVDDLEDRVAAIVARGIEPVTRETYGNGVRKVVFRDPDGNEVGFGGPPDQAMP